MVSLNDLKIASPCSASWTAMRGDDRVRFCDHCSKHVYDISGLTTTEAQALIEETEGPLCVRLHRRNDGTVITADCPVGLRAAVRRRCTRLAAAGLALAGVLRFGAWFSIAVAERPTVLQLPNLSATLYDWGDWANSVLGVSIFPVPPRVTMGAICFIPSNPSNGTNPDVAACDEFGLSTESSSPEPDPRSVIDRAE